MDRKENKITNRVFWWNQWQILRTLHWKGREKVFWGFCFEGSDVFWWIEGREVWKFIMFSRKNFWLFKDFFWNKEINIEWYMGACEKIWNCAQKIQAFLCFVLKSVWKWKQKHMENLKICEMRENSWKKIWKLQYEVGIFWFCGKSKNVRNFEF